MVTINVAALGEGVHSVTLTPEAEELELDPAGFRDVRVEAVLNIYEGRILARLGISSTARLECDRTLQLFDQRLEGSYVLLFAPNVSAEVKDGEKVDDLRPLDPWQREIDVTDAVRDTILLSVPVRCVAPGAEDLEIPTRFGASESDVDPRWAELARLRADRSESD